jgi:hypothetical protein
MQQTRPAGAAARVARTISVADDDSRSLLRAGQARDRRRVVEAGGEDTVGRLAAQRPNWS